MSSILRLAVHLARANVPVLPLRGEKFPMGNCPDCAENACGGRPNMKSAGPCLCPMPCHGWAAATTDLAVLTGPDWAAAWREATAVAYHPGGAGVTVLDLDSPAVVAWARENMPSTRTVSTTRGEHWIYRGVMRSANAVRPDVDIKSHASYARWLGPGTGTTVPLSDAVRMLAARSENTTPAPGGGVVLSTSAAAWTRTVAHGCRHNETFIRTGVERAAARIRSRAKSGAGSQTFFVAGFLAAQHSQCPGPCGLDTIAEHLIAAAVSVGVPRPYAARAVTNGFATTGRAA
ncbi:DNA primase [Kitasatospora cineracea]|uniref:DNA primase n=1 Tax=Kitasatospora cineracea TaxID=88074 RepID=UPI00340A6261